MVELFTPATVVALATLATLEIVLGVDNIVFLTLVVGRLPPAQQPRARQLGLAGALLTRLALLATLSSVMKLTAPWITLGGHVLSGRDAILVGGGLFLVGKAAHEIYGRFEEVGATRRDAGHPRRARSFALTVAQIALLDIVFSLDSVVAAVGMARRLEVMAAAVVLAAGVMYFLAKPIGDFVERHQGMKVLALSFLLLIGVLLVADGTGHALEKGYVYFAMAFAFAVEAVNILLRGRAARAASE